MTTKIRNDQIDTGTGANQIVKLDGSGRLPAVDGSQLIGVATGGSPLPVFTEDSNLNIVGGTNAGGALTTGTRNIIIGADAGKQATDASSSIFIGNYAGPGAGAALTGDYNTVVGYSAGYNLEGTSDSNVLVGNWSGYYISTGRANVAIGRQAMQGSAGVSTGQYNTAIGNNAGYEITSGSYNTLVGGFAGDTISTGVGNVAVGYATMNHPLNITGNENVVIGHDAGSGLNGAASNNVLIGGSYAGSNISTGSGNVCLGNAAGPTTNQSNRLYIDNKETDTPLIGGTFGSPAAPATVRQVTITGDLTVTGTISPASVGLFTEDANKNIVGGSGAATNLVGSPAAAVHNFIAGNYAGSSFLTTGDRNVMIGQKSGQYFSGSNSIFIGAYAGQGLFKGLNGLDNIAIGRGAFGYPNQVSGSADHNIALGYRAGRTHTGDGNISVGSQAAVACFSGNYNTVVGHNAGINLGSAGSNVILGAFAGPTTGATINDKLFIDNSTSDTPLISGTFGSPAVKEVTINGDLTVTGNVVGHLDINAQTGTTYTLELADDGKLVTMDNVSANTIKIPTDSQVNFPIGTQILLEQEGTGTTTIESAGLGSPAGGSPPGVAIHSPGNAFSLAFQYTTITMIKKAANTWLLVGDLV